MRLGLPDRCPGPPHRCHRFAPAGQLPRRLATLKIVVWSLRRSPRLVIGGHARMR
ncbi:hypothetical protein JCM18918_1089 [Cutibacterium acnes JCM 18918]|nr:hypothetical protein HMPREF9574_01243 [Cutibacterium acnes HL074PA1]EFT20425.1 hypothetical protein HMPREF9566_01851 [Cutibacterium acnes HL045PA1]EGF68614.1 hypothetical protein HMPREF9588_01819 [Cutibacterium acnes HL025PA2]EGR96079.1 conserved domain protein [Cutibacterium acnes SK182]GAE75385.1 hypothetical protein JCM18918_1089 [Cutibacterium acnes JCM 18918]